MRAARRHPTLLLAVAAALPMLLPASASGHEEEVPSGRDAVVVQRSPGSTPQVQRLEAARHQGYDRVVFTLDGPLPGYRVEYVDQVHEPAPSDAAVPLEGGAALQVTLLPAIGQAPDGLTFRPQELSPGLRAVREVAYAGDGDGRSVFGIGLARERDFRVIDLENPSRVVVDVANTEPDTTSTEFSDDDDNVHEPNIEAIAAQGVTRGCGADESAFCPAQPVTRGQMATFLSRALDLPDAGRDAFTDDDGSAHEAAANALAEAGITGGCTEDRFCPLQSVSRAQMASFLKRGFDVESTDDDFFADDDRSVHQGDINAVAAAGITAGCNALQSRFCPEVPVVRAQMATFLARAMRLVERSSLSVLLEPGDEGPRVTSLQQRLAQLKYWVGPQDGVYGDLTEQAVTAFQKAHQLERDGVYGPSTRAALASPQPVQARSSGGLVMEVDEQRQLLLMVRDGEVQSIFNTSTGTEQPYTYEGEQYLADTPNGQWTMFRQIDGWRESRLGRLYRPKYFHEDGIAIHGFPNVPPQPASHGCVRVSMAAMDHLWPSVPMGTQVWVY